MEADTCTSPRPQHRRNASSIRALVSPRPPAAKDTSPSKQHTRTHTLPSLPSTDQARAANGRVLGERQGNMQSPPPSPSKARPKKVAPSSTANALPTSHSLHQRPVETPAASHKAKSSTTFADIFSKKECPSEQRSQPLRKDKENTTPPSSSSGPQNTPIWAQFATSAHPASRPSTRDGKSLVQISNEIAKYTPQDYSPSKQRNFDATFEEPQLRPTLASRPQSMYAMGADIIGAIGRRASGDRSILPPRHSEDLERRGSADKGKHARDDQAWKATGVGVERKTSSGSADHAVAKEKLVIPKRAGRVMAAVAALQGKGKGQPPPPKEEVQLDPKAVEEAFEAVLTSRNVPEPMRQKMRSLTMRVKADFIKQDQEASKTATTDPNKPSTSSLVRSKTSTGQEQPPDEEDTKSTKRSRARSRTFTFSKSDKNGDASPSKKQRSSSKSRSTSTHKAAIHSGTTTDTSRASMDKRRSGGPSVPADFIAYLRATQKPVEIEVGRLHRLRILLRNETVAWVDSFISLGGMTEIVGLLHRIMELEWREEHEDQLLHETLLCLKGLCTTERAMIELEKVADVLFRPLMNMLYDDEKKGPAEYTTRTIIVTILFNFLASTMTTSTDLLEQRARRILNYLGEATQPEEARPVDFVLDMRTSRPYKLWCREITHVTKEVFWIFLHHLNVVPLPKSQSDSSPIESAVEVDAEERAKVLAATYSQRHFPGTRPPVPAAPYIGGVEWDATTYITAHLDLLNGLIASISTTAARNALRADLQASGFEKVLGATLRTCKEKFYSGVHDGLRAYVAAAAEDGWDTRYVREGPTQEEQAKGYSPKKSPKKQDAAPRLDLKIAGEKKVPVDDSHDDGWLE